MFVVLLVLFICSVHFQEPRFAAGQDECGPTSCDASGPVIRFPFRLKGRQPERCGYPGFDLSCSSTNTTEFEFQYPVRASARNITLPISARATVVQIDYLSQVIRVRVLNGSCLPNRVPEQNSSVALPFEIYSYSRTGFDYRLYSRYGYSEYPGYTLFNCSRKPADSRPWTQSFGTITCLGHGGFQVYVYGSYYPATCFPLSSCVKMYDIYGDLINIFTKPSDQFSDYYTYFQWREPSCQSCEERGIQCRSNNETQCFHISNNQTGRFDISNGLVHNIKGVSGQVIISVIVIRVFLTVLALTALFHIYTVNKRKREKDTRIQQFLEDYKSLRPARYTYSDVKKIADGFKHKLGQGGYGTVYKGKLSNDIPVAIKVLSNIKGNGEDFINEVATIGKIHHVNVVRLVGYCADGYRRALVYEFLENDSLDKYISSGNQSRTLGWEKLHKIALGIAKGVDYLHQGCNQRILHFDIKPQNILLDRNLNPKVADFGLAKLCSKEQSVVTMTAARGTIGYIAPEVFSRNFGRVSYKSDIYSLGMLLLDMIGGRKSFDARGGQESTEVYFPEWMYSQLEKGEDIAIEIEREGESEMVKRLIIVGLWCIQWYPADRPSTKVVIQMLENDNMPVMPPNPFAASQSADRNPTSSGSLFVTAQTDF